jgi:predicted MFS family arabinose efflux permease
VFIVAGIAGAVRPSDLAVRGALVADTVPTQQLTGAMGISRTTSDSARIVGSLAGAGLFATLGLAPAYFVVTSLYLAGLVLTMLVSQPRPARPAGTPKRVSPWRELKEGVVYVWTTPCLLAAMSVAFLVNLTAYPFTLGLLPYVAREIYHIDQTGLGYLIASFALGALLGSVVLSFAGTLLRLARMMIIFAAVWYVLLLTFAHMETPLGGIVVLILIGFAQSLSLVSLSVILLRTSSGHLRGRVMGVRMLAIYGLPLGLLAAGALIDLIGFKSTLTVYCAVGLTFVALIAARWHSHLWPLHAPANAR